ncbi:zinc ABC transporter ATP-binding protein AztA [Faunimonas sp. B44]|uniref:zinc ABC transporter ATP-binding protein AztA n=1 Tax=Faunimonas sp. B44 TaxID=3461493 RepID=UPI004044A524
MAPILRFRNLTLGYDRHAAVHHLDGAVEAGSLTAIIGPNGSGKSTLMKGIAGLLAPLGGEILRAGADPADVAYLPQQTEIDRSFPATVAELVSLGLWHRRGLFGRVDAAGRHRIDHAIAAVGLSGLERRGVDTLSGGQMQRTLFARVLLQEARLILLDEPFNAIDTRTVADLVGIVRRWHGEGRTVIAVLHDLDLVREAFPQALLLAREKIAWGPAAEVLRPENLLKARRLTERWDDHAPWCEAETRAA